MTPLADKHHLLSDIERAKQLFGPLKRLYERIPTTTCNRQAHCCKLMPEVSYVEFLHVVSALGRLPEDVRAETMEKTIKYFFLNAVRIDNCPFLHHNSCRIYQDRPFTCRAYGLWSKAYYEVLVAKNKKAKEPVRAAWETLGVKLPDDVVTYQPAYCDHVTMTSGGPITDAELDLIQAEVFTLDSDLEQGMRQFRQVFFFDPNFLLTSTIIGYRSCLVEKVTVVREYLSKKRSPRLEQLLETKRHVFTLTPALNAVELRMSSPDSSPTVLLGKGPGGVYPRPKRLP
ncbi:MAG: YkgJ family cysteine cluster protein [Deltaproteobacteria bacterium]|nr:YkgJ family cysteine cluster protein [Deltaproteobacteria bacterium]